MSIIRIQDISHVRFKAPDLPAMQAFLEEFGLSPAPSHDGRLYMRGCGGAPFLHVTEQGDPGFAGVAFRAASLEDLSTLAASEDVAVEPLAAPGGGFVVHLSDPDGHPVEVVAGQAFDTPAAFPPREAWNSLDQRSRLRTVKRTGQGPAHVARLVGAAVVLGMSGAPGSHRASSSGPRVPHRPRPGPAPPAALDLCPRALSRLVPACPE